VFRTLVVAAVLASGVLLGACGAGSDNAGLIKGAEQLQAAAAAQSGARVNAALATLGAVCTSMGVGPSSGGV